VFYELSINRQREIEETHVHPGGRSPRWVRYLALGVTIVALVATFWISVGQHEAARLHARSPAASAGIPATQQTGE